MIDNLIYQMKQPLFIHRQILEISQFFGDFLFEIFFVYIHKKSLNIQLEDIAIFRVILRTRADEVIQSSDTVMCSFLKSATVNIVNEMTIKKIVDIIVHKMVHNTIAETARKHFSFDRIGDNETDTGSDFISSCAKFFMKLE